ncbi:MAG: DUF721 domain-containing protein [Dysgonamonadaceae bacterium]|jgi:predicted nucleic acid-binding Zn ribbon protein|nr:DUF721 domain-containing protein [Dysgonamonadaceae bacterium]
MNKRDTQSIGAALSDFFENNTFFRLKFAEHRVVRGWYDLLGDSVASYTRNVYYRNDVLHVQLSSSVLRAELQMHKEDLIKRLNEYAGMSVIRDIVLR